MTDPAYSPIADAPRGPDKPFETRLLDELPRLDRFVRARFSGASGDLVQETLLRAWGARASFESERELWPWLRRIASNAASRRLEIESRRESTVSLEALDGRPAIPFGATDAPLGGGLDLRPFLERLQPSDRDVVEGHYFDGASIAELAAQRACPVGTVKSQLSRARTRLAALMAGAVLTATVTFVGFYRSSVDGTEGPGDRATIRSHTISIEVKRPSAPKMATRDLSNPAPPVWEVKSISPASSQGTFRSRGRAQRTVPAPAGHFGSYRAPAFPLHFSLRQQP